MKWPSIQALSTEQDARQMAAEATLRKIYQGIIIAAGGFDREGAEHILKLGDADLVAFGRFFTSNPDLPERFRRNLPLTPYHREAFWGGDERWYSDFPPHPGGGAN